MAVVYRHRRLDTFEVFYVGIGKSKKRAYAKSGRSDWWTKVINKVNYSVEILKKGISLEEAQELEELLIKEYGRRDLGLGNLVNQTDGGEFNLNISKEARRKISESKYKPVIKYDLNGNYLEEFVSVSEAAKDIKVSTGNICGNIKGLTKDVKGFRYSYKKERPIERSNWGHPPKKRPVDQYTLEGEFIKTHSSITKAQKELSISNISRACIKNTIAGGFLWKYKEDK